MKPPSDARKRTLALQERALRFSTGVNLSCPSQFSNIPSATIWRQLVRCADSVSANLVEADDASSTADFLYKIQLTLREAKESRQCLAKLRLAKLDAWDAVGRLEDEAIELSAIFATIAIKVASRLERESQSRRRN
ncbi:MAG: four helix bundle protein [Acidobacteriota bacterium]|nr:four helix bundle protein [Acidobacteriota bacterium]